MVMEEHAQRRERRAGLQKAGVCGGKGRGGDQEEKPLVAHTEAVPLGFFFFLFFFSPCDSERRRKR